LRRNGKSVTPPPKLSPFNVVEQSGSELKPLMITHDSPLEQAQDINRVAVAAANEEPEATAGSAAAGKLRPCLSTARLLIVSHFRS
jgi:hypothetical protein